MLAEISPLPAIASRIQLVNRAIEVVRNSIRATDVIGWHQHGQVLGVIFTELGDADKDTALAALKTRMGKVLQRDSERLSEAAAKLSFHWFPEEVAPPADSPDISVYPEFQRRAHTNK